MRLAVRAAAAALLSGLVAAWPARAAPGDPPLHASLFEHAFSDVRKAFVDREVVPLRVVGLGTITIASNRITASDPYVQPTRDGFSREVPNGSFPIRLVIADIAQNHQRVALARVDFADKPAVRWEMAAGDDADFASLKPDEIFGYGVDAGTGSFFDPKMGEAREALPADIAETLSEALMTASDTWGADHRTPPALAFGLGDLRMAIFSSGWGDGFYASWFGLAEDGSVVALVTDFGVVRLTPAP